MVRWFSAKISDSPRWVLLLEFQISTDPGTPSTEIHMLADRLITRMDHQFFWVLGLLVVSIILPIALRFGGR